MAFSPDIVVFIFLIQFLAFGVKALVGFGNSMISGPLLSLRMDSILITPATMVMDCPVNAWIAWKNRRCIRWRLILPLLLANVLGVIPGAWLLRFSVPWMLKTLLGVVVIFLGVEMAASRAHPGRPSRGTGWACYVVSFFSGICAGLFGINNLLTVYLQRTAKNYAEFKGSICFLFLGANVFRLFVYLAGGMLTGEVWLFVAVSIPAAGLAMLLFDRLANHLSEDTLQKTAIVLFILSGVSITVKSLLLHT